MLLSNIHETLANAPEFETAVEGFSTQVQNLTNAMFTTLPRDVSSNTKIGAPTQMNQLFKTLDFETLGDGETNPKSLTRQRGDGIKARHIPELLKYISDNDSYDYHIWGFEEPENSLDFVAAQSEAARLLSLAKEDRVQVFMTTHSPSFYLLEGASISRFYVTKDEKKQSVVLQGRDLEKLDIQQAIGEGFYLPAVAEALRGVAEIQARAKAAEKKIGLLKDELQAITTPVILTEGRTDARILLTAWDKLHGGQPPFRIRSCDTGGENAGSGNGGAQSLAICLKGIASDHPHTVIGLFDYDEAGIREYKLDRNFVEAEIGGQSVKKSMHGKSYAVLLPAPVFRDECKQYKNLPIEYLFRDEHLATEIEGKKLVLKRKQATAKVGDEIIKRELDDVTHFKDVGAEKADFADVIVPTFSPQAFDSFNAIFEIISYIINYENDSNAQH
nr:AAA family ATPase [Rhizobium sp. ICMP 5592]